MMLKNANSDKGSNPKVVGKGARQYELGGRHAKHSRCSSGVSFNREGRWWEGAEGAPKEQMGSIMQP